MVTEILHFHQETEKLGQRRFTEDNCSSTAFYKRVTGGRKTGSEKAIIWP